MASSGKKKTTMAKLTRESRLRERRMEKKVRKDARKFAAANPHLSTAGEDPLQEGVDIDTEGAPVDDDAALAAPSSSAAAE